MHELQRTAHMACHRTCYNTHIRVPEAWDRNRCVPSGCICSCMCLRVRVCVCVCLYLCVLQILSVAGWATQLTCL